MSHVPPVAEIPRRINLGCGRDRRPGWLNVDSRAGLGADLVWDLSVRPYPVPRGHFLQADALDVVEHLPALPPFMEEVHEILAPGGLLTITTPHFSCANAYVDPTHRARFSVRTFDFFTAQHSYDFHTSARFEIVDRLLAFHPGRVSRFVSAWANRHADLYEHRFAWIFPAWFVKVVMRAVK